MLKIEVIKFEAQDIITTSGTPAAPKDETNMQCICNPEECTWGTTPDGAEIFVHSNGCSVEDHSCMR